MNIYRRQMKKYKLTIYEYSKLLGLPYNVVYAYVNEEREKVMSFKNYFETKIFEKRNELEKENEKTMENITNLKLDTLKLNAWFDNEYNGCYGLTTKELYNKYDFGEDIRYEQLVNTIFYSKGKRSELKNRIISVLYDICNDSSSHLRQKDIEEDSKYRKFFRDFDLKKYAKTNGMTVGEFTKKYNKQGTTQYATNNIINHLSRVPDKKLKIYYDIINSEEKTEEVVKPKSELDMNLVKELVKKHLTDEEILLIKLFGGKI